MDISRALTYFIWQKGKPTPGLFTILFGKEIQTFFKNGILPAKGFGHTEPTRKLFECQLSTSTWTWILFEANGTKPAGLSVLDLGIRYFGP
jgi:hypothetical protein